jgi:hypothetical protein
MSKRVKVQRSFVKIFPLLLFEKIQYMILLFIYRRIWVDKLGNQIKII